ncbi:hypothetical protein GX586_06800 [bacterium]|nr:hypothetical protein [bacterium]
MNLLRTTQRMWPALGRARILGRAVMAIAAVSCFCAESAGYTVSVTVRDASSSAIQGAYVWVDVTTPKWARTDSGGMASVTNVQRKSQLVVARHPERGSMPPLHAYINSDTNFTVTLPPRVSHRIASYNVRGYGSFYSSQVIPLAKMFWEIQPDVVMLQECPSNAAFSIATFASRHLPGYTTSYSYIGGPVRNGILSFHPIISTASYKTNGTYRDLYTALIPLPGGQQVRFMSAHFASGDSASEAARRDLEAAFIGSVASGMYAQGQLCWLGMDANDDPADPECASDVHGILTNRCTALVELEPADDLGSLCTYPSWQSRLDFLAPARDLAALVTYQHILRTETMTSRPAWLASGDSAAASDHRMLYADMALIPEPAAVLALLAVACAVRRSRYTWQRRA